MIGSETRSLRAGGPLSESSVGGIQRLRSMENLVAKATIQLRRRAQIDGDAKEVRKLALHRKECVARNMLGVELHEHIQVAVRPKITANA